MISPSSIILRIVACGMALNVQASFVTDLTGSYDYIVAGGGASGLIVSERLAETGKSVLLLERGNVSFYDTGSKDTVPWNDTVTEYDVPALSYLLRDTTLTVYCKDIPSLAACILGGDTVINGLAWVRPQAADFDDKFPLGWKWHDMVDAAARFERMNPGTTVPSENSINYNPKAYQVMSGWLNDHDFNFADVLAEPNRKNRTFAKPAWDVQHGLRGGPLRTYFPEAQKLRNFHVAVNRKVIRVVREGAKVTGVEVEVETGSGANRRETVSLKETGKVILTAGAMSTPRILWQSGIGQSDQIEIVKNGETNVTLPDEKDWITLPVRTMLRDHPIIELLFRTTQESIPNSLGYNYSEPSTELVPITCADGITRYVQGSCNNPGDDLISIRLLLVHGQTSTGSIGMAANGSAVFVETPWLEESGDQEAMVTVFDWLLEWSRQPDSPLMFIDNVNSTSPNTTAQGRDYLGKYRSGAHWVGGAAMGTVVNTDLLVYGTENLFVADASFHPDLPTGNNQATIMLAAEKAAERILALDGMKIRGLARGFDY